MVDHASASSHDESKRIGVNRLRSTLTTMHLIGLARLVDRSGRRVVFTGTDLLRKLTRLPLIGPRLVPLLARIDRRDHFHFELTELVRVCSALSDARLPYWVTGGWGIDVLIGCQTRRHADLDFALDSFRENLPETADVLTRLGYRRKKPLTGTLWFPDAEIYEDDHGHHIEVHSLNWDVLSMADTLLDPLRTPAPESKGSSNRATPRLLEQCTAAGTLEGVSIPTLSVTAQRLFHLGYKRRPEDWQAEDVMRLVSIGIDAWINPLSEITSQPIGQEPRKPSTLLLIPVFTLPPELWRLCRLYHNDLNLIPPHVTLAFPFLPLESVTDEVVQKLTKLLGKTPAFDFELSQVKWFGTDVVYLEPSNSDIFRSIIETLQLMFPDFHPYDDAFDSVIPHVCLSEHGQLADRQSLGRLATKYLPFSSRASHVWMMCNERHVDEWSIVKIFHLDTSPLSSPSDGLPR